MKRDSSQKVSFDVQGHRGARGLCPENTLAAFERAIALGVTTLEMDVGISADGILVVCHDSFINPALCLDSRGRPLPETPRLRLKDLTLAQIQSFDCGSLNPDPLRFPEQQPVPGAPIPTLQQVFDLSESRNPQIRYNIESKVSPLFPDETASPDVFADKLVDLIEQNQLVDRASVQSFDWRVLQRVKQRQPAIQTVALVLHSPHSSTLIAANPSPFLAGFDWRDFNGDLITLLQATECVDVYSPNFQTLLPESPQFLQPIADFQRAGFPVIPWTVNAIDDMQRLIQAGVDGLITDFPDVLLRELKKMGRISPLHEASSPLLKNPLHGSE